jgi:hypothetical protein
MKCLYVPYLIIRKATLPEIEPANFGVNLV